MPKKITREEWLNRLANHMKKSLFKKEANVDVPADIAISCGFTSSGGRGAAIGECWYKEASEAKRPEIFIKPNQAEPMRVAGILAHEMIHATLGSGFGHGKEFKKIALAIGLEGKMTATTEGEKFKSILTKILKRMPPYPHKSLNAGGQGSPKKKQPWKASVNLRCPVDDYYIKTTLECFNMARPACPCCGGKMLTKDERG